MSDSSSKPRPKSPLSEPGPWDLVSEGYEEVTTPFLAKFSARGLAQLGLEQHHHFLDVACGPGTTCLLAADHVARIHALDFSPEMLRIAQKKAAAAGVTHIEFRRGDGQELPYGHASFDRAASMFGVMFFPDRRKGMRELFRVLKSGGKVLISSWAPVAASPAMQALFGALRAIDPSRPAPETDITSLENPEVLRNELESAGFSEVTLEEVTESVEFGSPELFWDAMVRGSAPLALLRQRLGEAEFSRQSTIAHRYLHELLGATRELSSTAFLAFGQKP